MPDTLDAAAVRRWCEAGLAGLRRHEHEINQLNVYPVPDGDTGTNLACTLAAAQEALAAAPAAGESSAGHGSAGHGSAGHGPAGDGPAGDGSAADALATMARGALLGARGNSGVIVSQLLRGLAQALADHPRVTDEAFAAAWDAAARAGYAAVASPAEGTILSVARAAAEAAVHAAAGAAAREEVASSVSSSSGPPDAPPAPASPALAVQAAADGAAAALARTPQELPVLATAGVVDAGGRGLVVLLDTLVEVLTGTAPVRRDEVPLPPPQPRGDDADREAGSDAYAYEVQYLLDADDRAVARLRTVLGELGDSLVVVGTGDGTWQVHVHVNDVGAAVEAGVDAGRPYRIAVTRFAGTPARGTPAVVAEFEEFEELEEFAELEEADAHAEPDPQARAAVVVASGAGLAELFQREGAVVVADRPATAEVLAAVRATRAGQVVVLPNDPDTRAVVDAAAEELADAQVKVAVVPTRSPVQALAALAVRDSRRRFDDDVIAMAEAAGACRYAEVCRASREALTVAGRCRRGDVLALVDGEVHLIGDDLTQVCRQLLDRLLGGGGELVSLVVGADAPADLPTALTSHLTREWPFVETQVHHGGQPHYPLVVGVE